VLDDLCGQLATDVTNDHLWDGSGNDPAVAALLAEVGPLSTARVVETGGGGTHVWVRVDEAGRPARGTG
jgi:hypothetical protein